MKKDILTDNSLMPFGKHEGVRMADVPTEYLIWLYENKKCTPSVTQYIESNMETIKLEILQSKRFGKAWKDYNTK